VTTITALLTNKAYGYPTRGSRRRRKPTILGCLHQTANAKATAIGERNYANRAGSGGPSATAYIDRDGTIVRAIDPVAYAAWSQGDVASPNTKIPTVAAAVASGVNSGSTATSRLIPRPRRPRPTARSSGPTSSRRSALSS
jgi:N-acetylmuramoyl-L-alanine amidase CwlA